MRSTRARHDSNGPGLLPILAAPVCLLGGLIVILAVLDRQARANADAQAAAPPPPAAPSADLELQREELDWRVEQLAESRSKTAADLESERLKLSHIEDHVRRLREEMSRMADAAEHLERLGGTTAEERAKTAADLARLQQRIADSVAELDEARKKTAAPSYAIIPYEGPNRTRRRPIFIECREDLVVIQPEGVELSPADFSGPLGPGNPLAAALRAAREHLTRGVAVGEGEPYPLLLVRPGGIAAYYKVREAIESWGSDFGYELIGEDWKLSFPTPDPTLAEIERRAVEQGRASEIRLAMSAPSRYGRKAPTYRAAPHRGGFIRQDGNGGSGEDGFGSGRHDSQSNARGSAHGFERHEESSAGGSGTSRGEAMSPSKTETAAGGSGRPAPAQSAAAGASGRSPSNAAAGAAAGQSGGTGGPAKSGSTAGSSKSGSSSGGASSTGSAGETQTAGSPQSEFTSQAAKRGENWALPDAARSAVPVTRPVRVLCRADRIAILPEKGEAGGKLVMLPGRTDAALDEFVSAMWEHMKGWGIAGNGLYWRPILTVQVGPDGAQRAADLKALLENSGIEYRDPVPSTASKR